MFDKFFLDHLCRETWSDREEVGSGGGGGGGGWRGERSGGGAE